QVHTPVEAAGQLAWTSPEQPGDWTPVTRRFRDGHTETWGAADSTLARAGEVAEAVPLVPGAHPAPPRRSAGIGGGLRAGRPRRGCAPVQPAQLGRARLQAGQARGGLGRLPGPLGL